ncbi:ubiquitin carboxyl-terminal hydrolase 14 [Nilaparvata lugens]|uniref:ubiquitin carboxyl-terminal hydrolase 14 n=1 Tax=Nilaparvata lugens TaxID=108931 RepID=UPI000B987F31|nr:ubiquitin carboxyl-terminal hydrolase 14 [Nilaparvata lugens]
MPLFKVKVKWGKESYNDVEVNTDEDPLVFKAQLYALTGVLPERQKVMLKGATLKDTEWGNFKVVNNAVLLLMGSKEDIPAEPSVKTVFVEDMNTEEIASAMDLPAGLANLGNTCYLNATVQCLKTVPELRQALQRFNGGVMLETGTMPAQSVTAALRDLYDAMEQRQRGNFYPPLLLLQVLHMAFPRFAEKSDNGSYVQQDANECWTEIVRMLKQKLPAIGGQETQNASSDIKSIIDQYFGITMDVEMKCTEADEPVVRSEEQLLQLSCFIPNEQTHMKKGIVSAMKEDIKKHSPTLGKDASYNKISKIKRLPAYLTVQFVRFFYKDKGINAKVLRDVKFPMEFDAYELCSDDLKQKLTPMRSKFKEQEDREVEEATSLKGKEKPKSGADKEPTKELPYWFENDVGSNSSGYYKLQAVLTHKGRSTSSGHYVAWIRQKENKWVKCDDENVTPVLESDILKLSGGGDWHCAYILLYGPRVLELPLDDPAKSIAAVVETTQSCS